MQSVGAATGAGDKTAAEIAASAPDGDGLTVEEEHIAGTDPTDPESKFTAKIEMVDVERSSRSAGTATPGISTGLHATSAPDEAASGRDG